MPVELSSQVAVELDGVSKGFGERELFSGLSRML